MTNLHETDRLVERLSSALKGYDEAVEWHSYRPLDVNREREQHAAAAVLADELRTAIAALTTMGGKAEPVAPTVVTDKQFVDEARQALDCGQVMDGVDPRGILAPAPTSPVQARTGEVTEQLLQWERVASSAEAFIAQFPYEISQGADQQREALIEQIRRARALSSNESNKQ